MTRARLGWLFIALGIVSIILVGFFHPLHSPWELVQLYWPVYGLAITLIAAGVLVAAE